MGCCCSTENERDRGIQKKKHDEGNNLRQEDNQSKGQSETIMTQPKEQVKTSSEINIAKGDTLQKEVNVGMNLKSDRGKKKAALPTPRTEFDRQLDMERATKVIKPLAEFSLNLYKKIAAENSEENIVFSPISVALALALVESGANGSTRTALRNVLNGDGNESDTSEMYQSIQRLLRSQDGDTPFTIANGLFYDREFELKPAYLSKMKEAFEAEIDEVDFKKAKEAAVSRINLWISNRTEGCIKELIEPDAIDGSTRLVLVNAIYLKPKWRKAFRTEAIEKMPFFRRGQDEQKVSFLCDLDDYVYTDDTDFRTVELPYASVNKLSFIIILPKERNGIRKVEEQLTEAKLRSIIQTNTQRKIDLKFPKFCFRTPVGLKSIREELRKLGLGLLFERTANFDRMIDNSPLYVDDVLHEAYIKVDEHGTEAAAATAVVFTYRTLMFEPPEAPIRFIAEHPFIFAIVHQQTETIVFIGKVNHIEEDTT